MPTYHVVTKPTLAPNLDLGVCPLDPCDIIADSVADAVATARSRIHESFFDGVEYAIPSPDQRARLEAYMRNWQPVARHVNRPPVDLETVSEPRALIAEGRVIGTHYDYGEATRTEAFDIIVGDVVSGRLERRTESPSSTGRVWFIAAPQGALASLASRTWQETSAVGVSATLSSLDDALADIRAALELN